MNRSKLLSLLEIEGCADSFQFCETFGYDSVVPGICMNAGCDYTVGVEPDCEDGWCESCDTGTVKSGLILLGVI